MASNPRLIVLSEQFRGQTFELTGDEYTIGRSETCDFNIAGSTLSGHHCTIRRSEEGDSFVVTDEDSTNGTRVNGVLIDQQELNNSDILQLGNVEVLYDAPPRSTPTGNTSSMTGISLEQEPDKRDTSVREMQNFSPFQSDAANFQESKLVSRCTMAFLGIAAVGVLGLLVWFIVEVVG